MKVKANVQKNNGIIGPGYKSWTEEMEIEISDQSFTEAIKNANMNKINENNKLILAIVAWQMNGITHPLTCNACMDEILWPKVVDDKVILLCPRCSYTQEIYDGLKEMILNFYEVKNV